MFMYSCLPLLYHFIFLLPFYSWQSTFLISIIVKWIDSIFRELSECQPQCSMRTNWRFWWVRVSTRILRRNSATNSTSCSNVAQWSMLIIEKCMVMDRNTLVQECALFGHVLYVAQWGLCLTWIIWRRKQCMMNNSLCIMWLIINLVVRSTDWTGDDDGSTVVADGGLCQHVVL